MRCQAGREKFKSMFCCLLAFGAVCESAHRSSPLCLWRHYSQTANVIASTNFAVCEFYLFHAQNGSQKRESIIFLRCRKAYRAAQSLGIYSPPPAGRGRHVSIISWGRSLGSWSSKCPGVVFNSGASRRSHFADNARWLFARSLTMLGVMPSRSARSAPLILRNFIHALRWFGPPFLSLLSSIYADCDRSAAKALPLLRILAID